MIFFENCYRFKKKFFKKNEFKLSSKIDFGNEKSNLFFINNLKKSKYYFEYGSGNSTLLAKKLGKRFTSIELDKKFYLYLQKKINCKNNIKYIDIGPVGEFSYPLFKNKKKIIKYIKSINKLFSNQRHPDLILIDGRFRIACCINIFLLIKKYKKKPIIIIDDFKKRKYYQILNKIFNIKKVGRMGVLTSKKESNNFLNLDDYIYDSR